VAKVLVPTYFAAGPLRRSWSKKPSIAFQRQGLVQPPFIGTWPPRQFRTSLPPTCRVSRVFAAIRPKRKMKPSDPRVRRQQEAVALPLASCLAAMSIARSGPVWRGKAPGHAGSVAQRCSSDTESFAAAWRC
jgi:hypothetical protein